jgi:hypothetical protein
MGQCTQHSLETMSPKDDNIVFIVKTQQAFLLCFVCTTVLYEDMK